MTHPYASLAYASAFGSDYEPIYLPGMDLYVLKRPILGTLHADAMGPYPLSPITSVAQIDKDFEILAAHNVVSLALVVDPLGAPPIDKLSEVFDKVSHFKDHFIRRTDLAQPYSRHHRAEVRRALRVCETRTQIGRAHV